jgi:ABC-type sugar transport systems, permease components
MQTQKVKNNALLMKLKSGAGQQKIIICAYVFIPLLLLFVFTYLPFGEMIGFSFFNMKYVGGRIFVGLRNYRDIFARSDIFSSLKLSLYYMGGSVVQLVLALFLATILGFKLRFANVFKGIMFFPYLINGIAIGFIFKFFFTRGYVLDSVLGWLGIPLEKLPYWLKTQGLNNVMLVGTSVWRYLGNNMVLFIGAILSIDPELYEAAELDGAGKWQQFRHIILPGIKTIFTLNIILSISGSLSAFEPPYVIASRGANGTATYFIIMDKIAHTSQKVGLASAMAVFLLVIIFIVTMLQNVFFKYAFRNAGTGSSGKGDVL